MDPDGIGIVLGFNFLQELFPGTSDDEVGHARA